MSRRCIFVRGSHRLLFTAFLTATLSAGCASDLERRFQRHIDYLASDELEGRGVGSRGLQQAGSYIADQFARIGLETVGEEGTYFQTFPIPLRRKLTDAGHLTVSGLPGDLVQNRDFVPFNFSSGKAFSGGITFCGYGIVAPEKNHDDFARIDLQGQVALMLRGEPSGWGDAEGNRTRHAMLRNKVYNAKDRGAVAALIVNAKPQEGEQDHLIEFVAEGADEYGVPAFHVSRAIVDTLFTGSGLGPLDELQKRLDAGESVSSELPHNESHGQAGFEKVTAPTRNVLGMLPGTEPEGGVIVIGAHYDHLGLRKPRMRRFKAGKLVEQNAEPQIHNGADDNASGVSGLIEVARMFAAGPRPKRSILFAAFTAEETGLQGSKYFMDHPVISLNRVVGMLNMDMIGRMKRGERVVQVFGTECGTGFADILQSNARLVGLKIAPIPDPGGNSDHASFVRRKVPSLHFFSGYHSDYHKPTDDANKINAQGGAKIAKLVYRTARALATQTTRPEFRVVQGAKKGEPSALPSYRVVMGLAPGYVDDGTPGMGVDAVNPDGPAALAGMQAGDRIIRISGKEVANVYDYMAATRNNKPGDTVEVVAVRKGKEITFRVTLAAAR